MYKIFINIFIILSIIKVKVLCYVLIKRSWYITKIRFFSHCINVSINDCEQGTGWGSFGPGKYASKSHRRTVFECQMETGWECITCIGIQ